jgi:hypothetical protein
MTLHVCTCMDVYRYLYTFVYMHVTKYISHARTSCTLLLYRHTHTETCHAFQETCKHHSRERVMYYSLSGISVQVWD